MQKTENFAYKYSDQVVSLLPNRHGLAENKFGYIPEVLMRTEGKIMGEYRFCQYYEFLQELKSRGKKILGYVGGHARTNAWDFLLDVMKLFNNEEIVYVLVGSGQEKMRLMKRVRKEQSHNIVFLDAVLKMKYWIYCQI